MPDSAPTAQVDARPLATPSRPVKDRSHHGLLWICAAFSVVMALAASTLLYFEREQTLEEGQRLTQSIARVIEEQTSRTIQTVDQRLQIAATELQTMQAAGVNDQQLVRAFLADQIKHLPFVRAMWTLDAQGRIAFDSDQGNVGISLADRDYFQIYQKQPQTGFYLGDPVRSRSLGTWLISAARPLRARNGSFAGIVVVAIEPPYFAALWSSVATESGSAVSLLRRDGTLLMRSPHEDAAMGRSLANGPLITTHLPQREVGIFRNISPIDGTDRYFAYRAFNAQPRLVLVVGRTVAAVLAPWNKLVKLTTAVWIAATIAAVLLSLYIAGMSRQRRRAEDRDSRSSALLLLASEATGLVVWSWDLRQDFWFVSPTFYTTLGYPVGDGRVTLQQWHDMQHPDDREQMRSSVAQFHAGVDQPNEYEVRMRHADGHYRWVQVIARITQRDAAGKPLVLQGVRIDVHSRKESELALLRAKQYAEGLIDGANVMIVGLDANGAVNLFNREGQELTGYSMAELQGRNWFEVMLPHEHYPQVRQAFNRLASGGSPSEFEDPILTRSGEQRLIAWRNNIVRQDGVFCGTLSFGIDVTERRRGEHALAQSEKRLRDLIDGLSSTIHIALTTPDGRLVEVNRAIRTATGLDNSDLIGFQIDAVRTITNDPVSQKQLRAAVNSAAAGQDTRFDMHTPVKGGGRITLDVTANALRDDKGQIVNVVLAGIDISHRRAAEQALRESNEKFQALVKHSIHGIVLFQHERIQYVNPAQVAITGYTLEESGAMTPAEQLAKVHPDDRAAVMERRNRAMAGEQVEGQPEVRAMHKDGSYRWLQTSTRNFTLGGEPARLAMLNDITERKLAELALQESETKYRLLVERSPYAIAVHQDGLLVMVNPAAVQLVGASGPEDLIGQPIVERLHLDTRAGSIERIGRMLAGEQGLYPTEDRYLKLDGTAFDVQVTAVPFTYQGRFAVQVVALDISDRKRAEEALRQSEARFRGAFDSSGVGMGINALDGRWLQVNPALCAIVGYSEQELLQTDFQSITHPDDLADDLARLETVVRGAADHFQMHKRYLHKAGHAIWVNLTVAIVRDTNGQPLHTIAQVEDINQRIVLEQELRGSEARLKAMFDALPDLLFEVALDGTIHDFHSPHTDLLVYEPAQFIGKRIDETLPPQAADIVLDALRVADQNGNSTGAQYALDLPVGTRWFELSIARKATPDAQDRRFIALARDISARIETEVALRNSEERFRELAENASEAFWLGDLSHDGMLYVSPNYHSVMGQDVALMQANGRAWRTLLHPDDRARVESIVDASRGKGEYDLEYRIVMPDGGLRWIHGRAFPIHDASGYFYRIGGMVEDVTARKMLQLKDEAERKVLEFLASDRPLPDVLAHFVTAYEELLPGSRGSVLLMDPDGVHIRHGAARRLPQAYCEAIDGSAIGPNTGSCGSAAFTGQTVMVADIMQDRLWQDYRELAHAHGLRACWSAPIKSVQHQVLGTFAFYFDAPRTATAAELALIERGAALVSPAIERHRSSDALLLSEARYRALVEWSPLGIGVTRTAC